MNEYISRAHLSRLSRSMHELNDGKIIKSPRRARGPSVGLPIRDLTSKQLTAPSASRTVCNLGRCSLKFGKDTDFFHF